MSYKTKKRLARLEKSTRLKRRMLEQWFYKERNRIARLEALNLRFR